jgi:hypothetical protein
VIRRLEGRVGTATCADCSAGVFVRGTPRRVVHLCDDPPCDQAKVLAWYDNEAGYAARVVDLCRCMGARAPAAGPALPNGSELDPVS